jgi:hypothetical protein
MTTAFCILCDLLFSNNSALRCPVILTRSLNKSEREQVALFHTVYIVPVDLVRLWISNVEGAAQNAWAVKLSCLTFQMTALLGGNSGFSINKEHLHSLLQTGAARKGCWLRFFEFRAASCLSTCFSVWSIILLRSEMLAVLDTALKYNKHCGLVID